MRMRTLVDTRTIAGPGQVAGQDVCLFVTYSPDDRIKPHVAFHCEAIARCGFKTVIVLVTDSLPNRSWRRLVGSDQSFIVRRNAGFDFGAWADVLRVHPELWTARSLLLVNDSILGPISDLAPILNAARSAPADLVGLTQSFQIAPHLQSYFLLMKNRALVSSGPRRFWADVRNLPTKQDVIETYEVTLMQYCQQHGVVCGALFPVTDLKEIATNPTVNGWRRLLDRGFPYMKAEVLRDRMTPALWAEAKHFILDKRMLLIMEAFLADVAENAERRTA